VPIVGVGDLLRYNVGEPRPVKTFYLMALKDVMGNDRVGASVYFTLDDLGTQRTLIFSRETCLDPYLLLITVTRWECISGFTLAVPSQTCSTISCL